MEISNEALTEKLRSFIKPLSFGQTEALSQLKDLLHELEYKHQELS